MEPLLPSEVARLIYGYLKKELNEDTAECFLKTSPHLKECYQMFQVNRNFNCKVNGFSLHDIFDQFGAMCSLINEHISEDYESKTLIEKLQYLLSVYNKTHKIDKCIETEFDCNYDSNRNVTAENNTSPTRSVATTLENVEINLCKEVEKSNFISSKSHVSSCSLIDTTSNVNNNNEFNSTDITNHSSVQISQCETPSKLIYSSKKCLTPKAQQTSFNNLPFVSQQNASDFVPSDCIQIPEATPLDSMPGLAKEEKPKETSIIVDTGELVDTFLKDKSLLEKIANNINKSLEIHDDNLEQSVKILDQPSLEKAIDSTQSDPQIKNILDEFLVFNVNNDEETSKNQPDNLQSSIKSRLRSAKKKDDTPNKIKKSINNSKHISSSNEECKNIEDSIILIGESNDKSIYIDNYSVLSNQIILQSNISSNGQSYTLDSSSLTPEIIHEDYPGKSNYVKIAPKITPLYLSQQGQEKHFFPKRKRRTLEEFGVRSKFRRTNLAPIQPMNSIKPTPSIVIQVPNQSTLDEAQSKNDIIIENIIRLPDITKEPFKVKENISHDTPDDRLKPPQNRSMSTPRRRSTHIRCLDFSTPQPKNSLKNNARSKLFNDSPKKNKKIDEEPPHSPIPKLQADWGSVNGFESMVKNNNVKKHWDSDIREMVGAGILTSDADARSRKSPRKKKTPKKRVNLNKNIKESKSLNNKQSKLVSDKLLKNKNVSNNEVVGKNEETSLLNEKINKNSSDIKKIQNDSSNINHNEQPKQTNFNTCYTQENENSLIVEENFTANINNTRPSIDETAENFTENTIMSSNLKQVENSLKHNSSNNVILSLCDLNNSFENSIKDSKTVISKEITTINLETPFKNLETPLEISKENCIKDVKKSSQCNQLESKTNTNGQNNQSIILNKLNSDSFENSKVVSKNNYTTLINPVIFNSETGSNTMNTPSSDCVLVENPCINNFTSPTQLENKTVENVKSTVYQNLPNLEDNKKLCELSNSIKNIESESQSNKHIIIETPCKCDDSAVDVPETPISKLLRECDPSKLMTPIASSPFNCEESLETPLTKVFRETSYLNRPPISPFPPTPGNSRSVDTIISLPSQELNINFNNQQKATIFNSESKLNNSKEISVSKHEVTLPNKNKSLSNIPKKNKAKNSIQRTKNESAIELKNIEDKKKQVYESVKIELFGSEISSSSSGDELDKKKQYDNFITTNSLTKKLEIPVKKEKKSGFKLIPQRMHIKAAQPFSCDVIQPSLNMVTTKSQLTNFPKPKLFSHVESYNTNKKTMKSMVHFDDPVEIIMNGTPKKDQNQSSIMTFSKKNISKKSKLNTIETPEPLIGLSRYLSKPSTPYKCRADEKLTIPSTKKKSILNENNSYEKNIFKNTSHNLDKNSEESYHLSKNETRPSLSCVKNTSYIDNDDEVKLMSVNSKLNLNNSQANSVLTQSINYFSSPITCDKSGSTINSNTSCITIGHNETSKSQSILPDQICLADFFKSPKIYEIITEDDEREVVCIQLSPNFDLLNIPSELNNFQQNISPLISKNLLNVTSELEDGELVNDVENLMTSTPKEIYDKKNVDKQSRIRRSPSFWEDSIHYLYKYRDDKHKDTSYRRSNNYRENRYEQKYRQTGLYSSYRDEYSQLDCRNKYQRSHFSSYSKREPREESVREKDKYKIKEDRRRNSRDYRAYDDYKRLDETERRGVSLKISQNDTQKSIRVDDILKKATKRSKSRTNINEIPSKISKVEHQRLLKNVNVDDFLSIVHGQ
ncbi:putative uncharacterized protein DDB_G0282133 isoform X2 [Daktulosphaira vitifoliae]|uniref:putative uncharacterized protein DDB_G0282133 isoform X2 n=1 Tax=Daktulosphaira vitifoliae TaxID=58002 RepID=UPI0021AAD676|nr:putative uncharacterized protein DDB_G0282133 isoform X2 [Daktulosphaira vitifoliae]